MVTDWSEVTFYIHEQTQNRNKGGSRNISVAKTFKTILHDLMFVSQMP